MIGEKGMLGNDCILDSDIIVRIYQFSVYQVPILTLLDSLRTSNKQNTKKTYRYSRAQFHKIFSFFLL